MSCTKCKQASMTTIVRPRLTREQYLAKVRASKPNAIASSKLEVGQTTTGVAQGNKLMVYTFNYTSTDKFNIKANLTGSQLAKFSGLLRIIITSNLTVSLFPRSGERFYNLSKSQTSINDSYTLEPNKTYYIKVIYTVPNGKAPFNLSIGTSAPVDAATTTSPTPTPATTPSTVGKRYAVVVGVSDYYSVSDLSFCDEDAVSWCSYLSDKGYEVTLLGDKTSSYAPYTAALATETNVRKAVQDAVAKCQANDQLVFVDSSHGDSDNLKAGNSFICCLDFNFTANGKYSDVEFAADLKPAINKGANCIVFLDSCRSGGFMDNMTAMSSTKTCVLTTCKQDGYGYDVSAYKHGAWTYYLLCQTLMKQSCKNLTDAFYKASSVYPYGGSDQPQMSGNGSMNF